MHTANDFMHFIEFLHSDLIEEVTVLDDADIVQKNGWSNVARESKRVYLQGKLDLLETLMNYYNQQTHSDRKYRKVHISSAIKKAIESCSPQHDRVTTGSVSGRMSVNSTPHPGPGVFERFLTEDRSEMIDVNMDTGEVQRSTAISDIPASEIFRSSVIGVDLATPPGVDSHVPIKVYKLNLDAVLGLQLRSEGVDRNSLLPSNLIRSSFRQPLSVEQGSGYVTVTSRKVPEGEHANLWGLLHSQ